MYDSPKFEMVVIYGRRRVGKTALIKNLLKISLPSVFKVLKPLRNLICSIFLMQLWILKIQFGYQQASHIGTLKMHLRQLKILPIIKKKNLFLSWMNFHTLRNPHRV